MSKWVRDFISLRLTGELREQPRRSRVQHAAPYAPDPRPMNRLLPLLRMRFAATGAISRALQRPFGPQDTSEAWWWDVLQDPRAW